MTNIIPKTDQYVSYKISKNIEIGKVKDVNGSEIITESILDRNKYLQIYQ